jgi:HAMP domain-containing protein
MDPMTGGVDVLATDGLSVIGTVGFFVPAAVLIGLVIGAVVRDRRISAREEAEDERQAAMAREEIPTPPRTD